MGSGDTRSITNTKITNYDSLQQSPEMVFQDINFNYCAVDTDTSFYAANDQLRNCLLV